MTRGTRRPAPRLAATLTLRCALIAALSACFAARAAEPATAVEDGATSPTHADPKVAEILEALERDYQDVETLSGEFKQVKRSEIFLEEYKSEGKFWHRIPDDFRCDYEPPYQMVNLIVDNVAYVAVAELKQVEKYVFDDTQETRRQVHQMLLGFGVTAKDILEWHEVTYLTEEAKGDICALRFTPREPDESGIDAITLWFERKKGKRIKPVRLLIEEGEDVTRIQILKLEFNPKLKDKLFEPDFPSDWDVIDKF